ncbi:MAG: ATP-binding protein [Candidatus Magnetominusculus sp. LBB02]|nr:ATP-binding protein [Candidatus Magnetominusculus sp. LBB02]
MKKTLVDYLLQSIRSGIVALNHQGMIVYANDPAMKILGFDEEQLCGRSWGELFPMTEKNSEFNKIIADATENEKLTIHREVSYVSAMYQLYHLSVTTSFLHEKKTISGIIVQFDDITELADLRRRERLINEERQRLSLEMVDSMKQISLSVAHVILNPVASIGGFARLIMKRVEENNPLREFLENIDECALRLENIVKSFKEYTSIKTVNYEIINLSSFIECIRPKVELIANKFEKEIHYHVDIENHVTAYIDPVLFTIVFDEIIMNSIESIEDSLGEIEIAVYKTVCGIIIEIKDTGFGIDIRHVCRAFDPFFTTKTSNNGIGLFKVKKIIAEHRGTITIQRREVVGTKVVIHLPANDPAVYSY